MKKIFPVLLVVLSTLALLHFFKWEKSVVIQTTASKTAAAQPAIVKPIRPEQVKDTTASAEEENIEDLLNAYLPRPEEPKERMIGFHEKIDHFFAKIPRQESLKNLLPSEMHDTPAPVLQAGKDLGEMHDYFLTHHHDINVELDFYLKCSQQKDFFDSARALCAARASQLFLNMTGRAISPKIFDDRIATLKDLITL